MKISNVKRILPCFLLIVVLLTAPALAESQLSITVICSGCGESLVLDCDSEMCSKYSSVCSCGEKLSCSGKFLMDAGEFLHHDLVDTSTSATCTDSGYVRKECSHCHAFYTDTVPALGGEHIWTETSRTDATTTAPGSIEYTCSRCNDTKIETIPQLPAPPTPSGSMTMSQLLSTMTSVFAVIFEWIAAVSAAIVSNPILLLCVVIGFISTGVVLFRRLLNL